MEISDMATKIRSNDDPANALFRARQLLSRYSKDELQNFQLEIEEIFFENSLINEKTWIKTNNPSLILQNIFNLEFQSVINDRDRSNWYASLVIFLIIRRKGFEDHPNYLDFVRQALALANASDERAEIAKSLEQAEKSERALELNDIKHGPTRELRTEAFREYENVRQELLAEGKKPTYQSIAERVWPRIQHLNEHPSTGKRLIGIDDPDDSNGIAVSRLVVWFGQGVTDHELAPTH